MYTVKFLKDSGAHKAGDIGELEKAVYKQLLAEGAVKEIDPNAKPEVVAPVEEALYPAPVGDVFKVILPTDMPDPSAGTVRIDEPAPKPAKKPAPKKPAKK